MNNVISSIDGANITLNDQVLASEVGEPMFFWYGQLLNLSIRFFPVLFICSALGVIIGYLISLSNKNSLDSKKSLDNK